MIGRRKVPLPEEEGKPGRVIQPLGAFSVGIPLLAVRKVQPRGGFAVALGEELRVRQCQSNALKVVDSLHAVR